MSAAEYLFPAFTTLATACTPEKVCELLPVPVSVIAVPASALVKFVASLILVASTTIAK